MDPTYARQKMTTSSRQETSTDTIRFGIETKTITYLQEMLLNAANTLIDMLGEFGMDQALPKGIPHSDTWSPRSTRGLTMYSAPLTPSHALTNATLTTAPSQQKPTTSPSNSH